MKSCLAFSRSTHAPAPALVAGISNEDDAERPVPWPLPMGRRDAEFPEHALSWPPGQCGR
ncbi:hypothetical protein D187_007318 [Cystobacter fuscus DSM 2262]|uniref:Uncharacterized protein n=1 Tax=Cystobacter fuscus (strain ATCC 25194 / DSM 2262 / NBRC 100088 / M29) TaxID=1242864 RepID=S9P3Q2_CYSF2|nr:hypothetical protein D187_007318 [Cystobacter fuscus DSM 2262]